MSFPNSEIIAGGFNISNGDFLTNSPKVELLYYGSVKRRNQSNIISAKRQECNSFEFEVLDDNFESKVF